VKESSTKLAVLASSDDALSLDSHTTWPTRQRTGHVTQIQAPWRHVLRWSAYLCTQTLIHDTMLVIIYSYLPFFVTVQTIHGDCVITVIKLIMHNDQYW